jgi:hypothetical protein
MEHVVDLPPGTYTFNLLLADQGHIPYFVYGKPVRLTIKSRRTVPLAEVLGPPRVAILQPAPDATVRAPVRVQFHASGYNVAHADAAVAGTGHFRLTLARAASRRRCWTSARARPRAWLLPPKGEYQMTLELVSNHRGGQGDRRPAPAAAPGGRGRTGP